jgi:hypothetical protein
MLKRLPRPAVDVTRFYYAGEPGKDRGQVASAGHCRRRRPAYAGNNLRTHTMPEPTRPEVVPMDLDADDLDKLVTVAVAAALAPLEERIKKLGDEIAALRVGIPF